MIKRIIIVLIFVFIVLIVGFGLIYLYNTANVELDIFKAEEIKSKNNENEEKSKGVDITQKIEHVDYINSIEYAFDFNPDTNEVVFEMKNLTDEELNLNFKSKKMYEIEIIERETNYSWKLSKEQHDNNKGDRLKLLPKEIIAKRFLLPEDIEIGFYTIKVYSLADELIDKDTIIEKIQIIKGQNSEIPTLDETSSFDISSDIAYLLSYNADNKILTVLIGNLSDKTRTLEVDNNIYELTIYKEDKEVFSSKGKYEKDELVLEPDTIYEDDIEIDLDTGDYRAILDLKIEELLYSPSFEYIFNIE